MIKTFSRLNIGEVARTAWIFGAGASAVPPYNVPVQNRLLNHFATMPIPSDIQYQSVIPKLRGRIRRYCNRVQPGLSINDPTLSLEEVFSAYELAATASSSSPAECRAAEKAIRDLREVVRFSTSVYGRGNHPKWKPHHRVGIVSPYAQLLELLFPPNDPAATTRHSLITFNYDICLDRCVISLRNAPTKLDLNYGIALSNHRDARAPEFSPPVLDRSVLLLRTHGALNWLRCQACQSIFTTVDRHANVSEATACWTCGRERLDHVFVHPSYLRSYNDPIVRLIWGRCQEELVRADRWVFIGYSFPVADVHFREMLRECLREREKTKPSPDIIVVDKGPTSEENFKRIATTYKVVFGKRVRFWQASPEGFSDFVHSLDP